MKKITYTGSSKILLSLVRFQNAVAGQMGDHTVEQDVPVDAVFTDTVYDDTALAGRVTSLEENVGDCKAVLQKLVEV